MSSLSAKCGGGAWTLVMKLDKNKVKYIIVNGKQSIDQYLFSTIKLKSYNPSYNYL